jgi:hypothetical protein
VRWGDKRAPIDVENVPEPEFARPPERRVSDEEQWKRLARAMGRSGSSERRGDVEYELRHEDGTTTTGTARDGVGPDAKRRKR